MPTRINDPRRINMKRLLVGCMMLPTAALANDGHLVSSSTLFMGACTVTGATIGIGVAPERKYRLVGAIIGAVLGVGIWAAFFVVTERI